MHNPYNKIMKEKKKKQKTEWKKNIKISENKFIQQIILTYSFKRKKSLKN